MSRRPDYIGFDPVRWIERLREVNRGSQFDPDAKKIIEADLAALERKLERTQ